MNDDDFEVASIASTRSSRSSRRARRTKTKAAYREKDVRDSDGESHQDLVTTAASDSTSQNRCLWR